MVGEMRDAPTMQTVLTAAETGHLVFSTLHTNSASQTIDRIMDSFPQSSHRQLRQQLSSVLEAVASMKLVERADGKGLIAAIEILRRTPRVAKLLLQGNLEALDEEIESSVAYHKMQSMNQSLAALVAHRAVTLETALAASANPSDLDLILRKLLYSEEQCEIREDENMAEPLSDFSKIVELQEIKRLYDEVQEHHAAELAERDDEIARLRAEAMQHTEQETEEDGEVARLREENERLTRQLQLVRKDYDAKVERLNARIRELSGNSGRATAAPEPERKGFFRR
jgi:twitching motility protein PilT